MEKTRRGFLKSALAAASLAHLSAFGEAGKNDRKLDILILGGTGFLGPHTIRAALARGHRMTLFNRGKTNPHLFPELEKLIGDRDGDLLALKGRRWDAVIDTSGYVPRLVRDSAALLAPSCDHYMFVSSVSVYESFAEPGMDEDAPLGTLENEGVEEVTSETYGPLKVQCERAATEAMAGRATIIRPGLIVGPGDPTDRFTYWPVRVAAGGEVLAPGEPNGPLQVIDVRDLASWMVRCLEERALGTYNAISPAGALSMGNMMIACREASGSEARFTWVEADFLEQQGVAAWSELPAWLPPRGDYAGFGQISVERATARGLSHRDLRVTIRDTLEWWESLPDERRSKMKAGLSREREREVLAAWHEHDKAG